MHDTIPEIALPFGLSNGFLGTHTCRTMMLKELTLLLEASAPDATHAQLRELVIDENVTLKATLATRKKTWKHLSELYTLKRELVVFRALRDLWGSNLEERPLLALLCVAARDPLLRATVPAVLPLAPGTSVTPQTLEARIHETFPDRFNKLVQSGIARNTISSWAQSGHLAGKVKKTRSRAVSGPATTAYALLLGYLCGVRGTLLFETPWATLLDASEPTLDSYAFAAAQRGWLDYRRMGNVADISLSFLLREEAIPGTSSTLTIW